MGTDFLDITFGIEKAFQIHVSNEELSGLVRERDITAGDLYGLVLTKLNLYDVGRNNVRLNEQFWLEMQRVLHCATDAPLDEIELQRELETLFPRETRRARWNALRDACPYRVRELDYPQSVRITGFLLAAGVVLVEQLQIWQIPGVNWFWPLLGVVGIWMFGETYLKVLSVCAPLRNQFPSGMKTVKELCRTVLAINYADICKRVDIPLDQRCPDVWRKLVEILAEALDVDPDKVTFRSRLIGDLGAA